MAAKAKPVVEQVKEGAELANWLERAEFTGLGAAQLGCCGEFSHWRWRVSRLRVMAETRILPGTSFILSGL